MPKLPGLYQTIIIFSNSTPAIPKNDLSTLSVICLPIYLHQPTQSPNYLPTYLLIYRCIVLIMFVFQSNLYDCSTP